MDLTNVKEAINNLNSDILKNYVPPEISGEAVLNAYYRKKKQMELLQSEYSLMEKEFQKYKERVEAQS